MAEEQIDCALRAVYNWSYEPEIDELRTLYANAVERQWVAVRDLDWEREIDPSHALAASEDRQQFPITELDFWRDLSPEARTRIALRQNAFMLSQFLHGEQGALMVASQLVNAVPHMDAKFYAATQTMDEARHVEVFARYVEKLDEIYEIDPMLRQILDATLSTDDWPKKFVGMQIVLEGLALASFRNMRRTTREPLLAELLRLVSHDEARHTGYGIKYLRRVVPTLPDAARAELEDFAFETARLIMDQRTGGFGRKMSEFWAAEGVDADAVTREILAKREHLTRVVVEARREAGFDADPIRGFVLPTLRTIGLYSERIHGAFTELVERNMVSGFEGTAMDGTFELPEDLEAWVDRTS